MTRPSVPYGTRNTPGLLLQELVFCSRCHSVLTACRRYYLVQRSSTLQLLEQAIHTPALCDIISICKLLALFALGEAYSTRTCLSEDQFPGIGYYVSATRMLRVLSEQPRIDCVEIMMALELGYAVRFGIIMGLHLNVPQNQLPSRELQEHRNRVWWTAYILDRSWACMLGKPVSIQDEDIDVNLPSTIPWSSESTTEDFADTDYLIASLRIANLGAQITGSIYSRRTHGSSFSCRVQQAHGQINWFVSGGNKRTSARSVPGIYPRGSKARRHEK
ncbi:hypothetical protein DIZ76_016605 [Coccidioides immitis]|nr:hypothetical protein DIZ76_016605 [Coccidioides immitis]